jgi:hypothetical protein
MKTNSSRTTYLFAALVVALLWAPEFASAQSARGVHLTRNGFRTHVFAAQVTRDADGNASSACMALTSPQVEAARIGLRVSRAMSASMPTAVVRGPAGGATFDVTYTDAQGEGFNHSTDGAKRRLAFETALLAWTKVIRAEQPIRVEATMHDMDDGDDDPNTSLLATAGPSEFWIVENKAVPSPLAWQMLGGRYSNAGESDISVNVNQTADWDYRLDGQAERGKFSFVYTLMHEIAHGLGHVDSFDLDTGKLLNDPTPFVYDVFVNRGSSQRNRVMDHAPEEVKRDMVSRDLFFNGENAVAAARAAFRSLPMIKLYAPDPFQSGSSMSHVDQDTYADIRTGLMTPIDFGAGSDKIDKLTLAIMKDMGYSLVPDAQTTRKQ